MKKKWTKRRRIELEKLRELLIEAGTINHGSHATDRIILCEKLAKALFYGQLNSKSPESFYQFLVSLVIAEDHPTGTAAPNEDKK